MPLTGNFDKDIRELTNRCKAEGKFGTGKRTSFRKCHKRALAAAFRAQGRSKTRRK